MNKLFLFPLLGALSLSSVAQTLNANTVNVTANREIELNHRYPMMPDEFYKFVGTYDLSNGMSLSMFNRGSFLYAQLNDQLRHRIVATTPDTFVSMDKQLKIKVDLDENGEASGEVYLPAS